MERIEVGQWIDNPVARYKVRFTVLPQDAAGLPHVHPWSVSADELQLHYVAECTPADLDGLTQIINAVVTSFGLARVGKSYKAGQPGSLGGAGRQRRPKCPAGPPMPLTRLLLGGLAALGRAASYRPVYEQYGAVQPPGMRKAMKRSQTRTP